MGLILYPGLLLFLASLTVYSYLRQPAVSKDTAAQARSAIKPDAPASRGAAKVRAKAGKQPAQKRAGPTIQPAATPPASRPVSLVTNPAVPPKQVAIEERGAANRPETATKEVSDRLLPLEVTVNGAKSGTWLLLERDGVMYAPFDAFEEWRVQLPPDARPIDFKLYDQTYWPLSAVPGYKFKLDFANQSAELLFSPEAFAATRLARERFKRPVVSPVLPSLFLNYDWNYLTSTRHNSPASKDLGLLAEIGASGSWGVLTSSHAGRNLTNDTASGAPRSLLRLETTFTRDFPHENRTLRLGDSGTRAGMWGRNVYFGGIQYGTNFALTPGFISQPMPALAGVSTAPSTVEMYVNDVLRQTSSVPAGPFAIDNFPLMTGGGDVRLVVRDLLGRETVIEQSFFVSTQLLAAGLSDWGIEAGSVRRDIGIASNHYGPGFASGTWRHGLSNTLTTEGRVEAAPQLKTIGLGILSALPGKMLAKASLAASHAQNRSGQLWLLGLEHQSLHNSVSLQAQGASVSFRQLGQPETVSPIRAQLAGNWTYSTEDSRTFGIGLATLSRYDDTRVSTVSGNYAMRIGERNSLNFTASRALDGASGTSIGALFIMPLDNNRTVSASANSHAGQQDFYVSALKNPTPEDSLGWRALAGRQASQGRLEGGMYYLGSHGSLTSDVSASPDRTALRLGANGGLVLAERTLFATQRVDQSFAVAEVTGYENIGIGLGSTVLAHTDANGIALVPRLMPYQSNSVRLAPDDLPVSAEIDSLEQLAVPAWRSAVKVTFPVRSGRGALLKIVLEDGGAAPAGATVQIEGDQQQFYVARRGEAFVTGLKPANTVLLNWNGQQCRFEVALPPDSPDEIPRLGPLLCKGVMR